MIKHTTDKTELILQDALHGLSESATNHLIWQFVTLRMALQLPQIGIMTVPKK